MRGALVLALLGAAGCGTEDGPLALPDLDVEMLRGRVQPMFDRVCAQTSCHGEPKRPFRLYSRFGLRGPAPRRSHVLSETELDANLQMARGFLGSVGTSPESMLLRKPLREAAGGVAHGGGDQFYDRVDPDYLLLACWLEGGGLDDGWECAP